MKQLSSVWQAATKVVPAWAWVVVALAIGLAVPRSEGTQAPVAPTATATPSSSPEVLGAVSPQPSATPTNRTEALVVSVTDGDTFKVSVNGQTQTVRLVGVNTPETVDPRRPVQCFGQEASAYLKKLLTGQTVFLESDVTQSDKDKYGRWLRFAFLTDGRDVGLVMLQEGYAQEALYSSQPHQYRQTYLAAQNEAQQAQRGLWAPTACVVATPTPSAVPTSTPASTPKPAATTTPAPAATPRPTATPTPVVAPPAQTGGYSCTGPDLDCKDFATHASAQAFFDGCGFSAANDPMELDNVGPGDGVACESRP